VEEPLPKRGRTSPSLENALINASIQNEDGVVQLQGSLEVQSYVKAQEFLQTSDERYEIVYRILMQKDLKRT
jgi:hypothetical protein